MRTENQKDTLSFQPLLKIAQLWGPEKDVLRRLFKMDEIKFSGTVKVREESDHQ